MVSNVKYYRAVPISVKLICPQQVVNNIVFSVGKILSGEFQNIESGNLGLASIVGHTDIQQSILNTCSTSDAKLHKTNAKFKPYHR